MTEKKKLDPIGSEDGDIDNDGDKDASDEYLAKRRKAISKAIADRKKGDKKKKEGRSIMSFRKYDSVYARIIEDRKKRTAGALPPEDPDTHAFRTAGPAREKARFDAAEDANEDLEDNMETDRSVDHIRPSPQRPGDRPRRNKLEAYNPFEEDA